MYHSLLASLATSILVLVVLATPVQACLNDRETNSREIEFKSQYNSSPGSPSVAPSTEAPDYMNTVLLSAGGILATASLGVGIGVGITAARR